MILWRKELIKNMRGEKMVLLVVDTQKLITNEKLYQFSAFKSRIKSLIQKARTHNIEVIFVRHDDGEGAELTKGTDGFEICEEFRPAEGEMIFDKTVNSSFNGTGLLEYLKEKGENTVMIVGLQTEYCIDATIKCGFEHGFKMIVPENTNSTFDNQYMTAEQSYKYYNEFIWNKRYAEYITFDEAIRLIERT